MKKPIQKMSHQYRKYNQLFWIVAAFLTAFLSVIFLLHLITRSPTTHIHHKSPQHKRPISLDVSRVPITQLADDIELAKARNPNCSFWDCFNVYRCGQRDQERIAIYVYPLRNYVDKNGQPAFIMSKEFYLILKSIVDSPYYTPKPSEACILVPSIDTLNQAMFHKNLVAKALGSLPHWNNGENHLLFNMFPGEQPSYNTVMDLNIDSAIIAGTGFDSWSYRFGFDLSIPFYNPLLLSEYKFPDSGMNSLQDRSLLLISGQIVMHPRHIRTLKDIAVDNKEILVLRRCNQIVDDWNEDRNKMKSKEIRCNLISDDQYEYPEILQRSRFCLVIRDSRLVQINLIEIMASNCIPVIVADNIIMPFHEVIDWTLASIVIRESDLHSIVSILKAVSMERIEELQLQIEWLYGRYFQNIDRIVTTVLDQLNDRVFPHLSRNYINYNVPEHLKSADNPLFLPLIAPQSHGFTAVILTYDRVDSLFTLIQKLSVVPSLQKILVIWNNQRKAPPHLGLFPKINKPFKVIRTKANKLSNRFYPYEEIETEAILTIDDDIVMLTADELDFGYEVWREFPDRIVGFPSRTHVWDNTTNRWRYESEWTNQISMVLTGAAFHHKYWSFLYTNAMPGDIKEWVDNHMNCEDIAMNFLVANITNKSPIKVAPRKKFKCPECTNTEMLSADLDHMMARTACINRFTEIYGAMPLKTVEFRADPVLYKDYFPEKLKRFNDIGSL